MYVAVHVLELDCSLYTVEVVMLLFAVAVLVTLKYTVGWLIVSLGFIVSVTISPDLAYSVSVSYTNYLR